jgi:putative peptidoglycan lipid II flippase
MSVEKEPSATDAVKHLDRTVLRLLPLQLIARVGEALMPILLAGWFGADGGTDLAMLVSRSFLFAGALLIAAFQDSVFIPSLTEAKKKNTAGGFAGAILMRALALGAGAACFCAAALLLWLWVGVGLGSNQAISGSNLAASALGIVALYACHMLLSVLRAFLVGALHTYHAFTPTAQIAGVGTGIALVAIATLRWRFGIVALPLGLLVGEVAKIPLLWRNLSKHVYITLNWQYAKEVSAFHRLASMEVLGNLVTRINPLVDQVAAGLCGVVGGGTLLGYAFDLASLPTTIAQAAFFSVMLTHLSDQEGNPEAFRALLRAALVRVCGLALLLSLLISGLALPLAKLIFLRQSMTVDGVRVIAEIVPYAALGSAAFGALLVLARAHVALKNTRIMLPLGIANAALNGLLNFGLYPHFGLRGIALSTSIVHAAIAVAFYVLLPKERR